MGFKTQKGFLFTGSGDGLKYVSGKRQSWYISEQGNPGVTDSPVFQSAATNTLGTKVILTYNKALSATTAAASAFAVTAASGSIVSTNLKLHLDAANSTSYGGSGTTWIDLISGDNARSVEFDGTDDYLTSANSSDYSFGSGDFTVEGWFNLDSLSTINGIVGVWGYSADRRSWGIQTSTGVGGTLKFYVNTDGTSSGNTFVQGGSLSLGQWYHFAAVRTGNTLKLFLNGTEVGSTSFTGTLYNNTNDGLSVGQIFNGDYLTNGKISNIRVVKGTAVYTSAFTTPTEPLTNITNTKLLCCNNSSTTGSTVTSGTITATSSPTASISNPFGVHGTISGATYNSSNGGILDFDGTDDYAVTEHSSDFDFGSGDFTVEAWCKPTNSSQTDPAIIALWNYPDGRRSWTIFGDTGGSAGTFDGSIRAAVSPDGAFATRTEITGTLTLNAWNHVVFTRISNTLTFYINNSSAGTASYTGSVYSNTVDGMTIGAMGDSAAAVNEFDGGISQVRIYKGTGLTAAQVAANYNATKTHFAAISSVASSGSTVELTMGTAITVGEAVTVAYTDPTGSDDTNAIQDISGNDAASFSATSVTNLVSNVALTAAEHYYDQGNTQNRGDVSMSDDADADESWADSIPVATTSGKRLIVIVATVRTTSGDGGDGAYFSAVYEDPIHFTLALTVSGTTTNMTYRGTYAATRYNSTSIWTAMIDGNTSATDDYSIEWSESPSSGNHGNLAYSGIILDGVNTVEYVNIGTPAQIGSWPVGFSNTDSQTVTTALNVAANNTTSATKVLRIAASNASNITSNVIDYNKGGSEPTYTQIGEGDNGTDERHHHAYFFGDHGTQVNMTGTFGDSSTGANNGISGLGCIIGLT